MFIWHAGMRSDDAKEGLIILLKTQPVVIELCLTDLYFTLWFEQGYSISWILIMKSANLCGERNFLRQCIVNWCLVYTNSCLLTEQWQHKKQIILVIDTGQDVFVGCYHNLIIPFVGHITLYQHSVKFNYARYCGLHQKIYRYAQIITLPSIIY